MTSHILWSRTDDMISMLWGNVAYEIC